MADNRNFAALDWLIHEISETLQDAQQALEAYVENPEDATRLRSCSTYIHQVHGSLQMMEFFGAALLADEMDKLTQAMMQGSVATMTDAQEVLMRAILQFPGYLEQVKLTRNDNPLMIVPLLNDLRAMRGDTLLADTSLFVPNLAPAKKIIGARLATTHDNVQFQAMAHKLRQMFQYAAAGFIRAPDVEENLAYLQKVFARLHKLTQGTARNALWDICLALAEALETGVLDMSAEMKNLLRELDKEIKILAVHGIKSLTSYTNDDIIKSLLFYVTQAGNNSLQFKPDSHLQRVYKTYHLASATVEANSESSAQLTMLSVPDSDAMRSVVDALQAELGMVKLALDECMSDPRGQQKLHDVIPVIKRIADTMAVLGLDSLRKSILAQGTALELLANADNPLSNDQLMVAAGNINAIENELDNVIQTQAPSRNVDAPNDTDITLMRAKESVLRESRTGLERTKNAIVEYISSQWDRKHLKDVPATLREIRGGLGIIPLPDAARIIDACARYIEEQLLTQEFTPQWSKLDSLADAIASVEYYLEQLNAGSTKEENDILLTVAEESVALLGYGAGNAQRVSAASDVALARYQQKETHELPTADVAEADQAELAAAYQSALQVESLEDASTAAAISGAAEKIRTQSDEVDEPAALDVIESETAAHAQDRMDIFAELESDDEPASLGQIEQATQESSSARANQSDYDDEEIDDEIIEIFVEEAAEVLQAIAQHFPVWAQKFDNEKALIEFRRAFHTLKGSGRMVEANDIAKLAWSIENMLNRILDGSIPPGHSHVVIIENVVAILPAMVDAFGQKRRNPHPELTEQYCELADALARGETPDQLLGENQQTTQDLPQEIIAPIELTTSVEPLAVNEPASEPEFSAQDELVSYAELEASIIAPVILGEDEQLWDIFAAEARVHLQTLEEFIAHMDAEAPCYETLSDEVQRGLHTLKGSAYMSGVTAIADLVAPLEKFAKELRSYQVVVSDDILQLLRDAVLYTHAGLEKIEQRVLVDVPELEQFVARVNDLHNIHIEPLIHQHALGQFANSSIDPKILSLFMTEELNFLLDAEDLISQWQRSSSDASLLQPLLAEVQQLTRGAQHAGLPLLQTLSETLEHLYGHLVLQHLPVSDALCKTLNSAHLALLDMMDTVAAGQNLSPAPDYITVELGEWIAQADANATVGQVAAPEEHQVAAEKNEADVDSLFEEALTGFDTEATDAVSAADDISRDFPAQHSADNEVADDLVATEQADATQPELMKLEPELTTASDADEPIYAHEKFAIELSDVQHAETDVVNSIAELSDDHETVEAQVADEVPELVASTDSAKDISELDSDVPEVVATHIQESPISEPAVVDDALVDAAIGEDFDPEIIEIFLEEALELLEDIERALHQWQEDASASQPLEELKRYLHTFKGGARLAGLTTLGDLSHDFESLLIDIDDSTEIDQELFSRLNHFQDLMHKGVGETRAQLSADYSADDNVERSTHIEVEPLVTSATPVNITVETEPVAASSSSHKRTVPIDFGEVSEKPNVMTFAPKARPPAPPIPQVPGSEFGGMRQVHGIEQAPVQHLATRRTGPQEVVKVPAQLLEELVNLAGETSISRSRMQQQVTDLSGAIGEMDSTILRLQEQLRRLDIETEAQVVFRQEKMAQQDEFDPLEMDRYSQLQQLSRSLIESASDLMDLKYTLADKTRDAETLLLQQARINTDLQEGLMRSRMVPFSRLVPRLRRIVRQAAVELGKEVDFELDNVEGELDRSVLERMIAPLEHMLRNAVDHGIESAEERAAAGKPVVGRITLSLSREGGDVMLRLSDDGHGINLKRVREKAIERGLISGEARLSEQDLMQFILHAGFSTADKVTQISGRGVGMDVVHSEIKQLGGAMFIDSRRGQGTEFIVRLPFTVSVNRALMVQVGDDLYAIPLNTIEGIVRVSPFELEHYYQDETARFDYAGENYVMRYLGAMLESGAHPKLEGQVLPLPVVLVRSADVTVALQVDRLLGSREIVVKTLGAQFSSVQGVSGATVMGDGSVVVILDLHALIREQLALGIGQSVLLEPYKFQALAEQEVADKIIMVVDDSVTVRKVTTRFLEREGYRVITAKDGIEALQLLQDRLPDVMLLDIEMPRMDGFEVAKNIRSSSRMKDLPIIMITSRTGDKHRERALDLGVNKYMGKPYQEDLLLATIEELMQTSAQ